MNFTLIFKFILFFNLLFGFPCLSFANTGVFFGSGNQIIPIKNSDIQLNNESIQFLFDVPPNSAKWGIPFIPKVRVKANLELINHSDKKIPVQMGFPFLDLQGFGDEKEVFKNLNFKVSSNGVSQKTLLKEGVIEKKLDPEGLFKKVFTWIEVFNPNQTKKLNINYSLKMSAGVHPLVLQYPDDLFGITYFFSYITKSAYTWKPPLEFASFTADITSIIRTLKKQQIINEFLPDSGPTISQPLMTLVTSPIGKRNDNGNSITWRFRENLPEDGITLSLNILTIPIKIEELKPYLLEKESLKSKEEYLTFLETLLKEYKGQEKYILFKEDSNDIPKIIDAIEKEVDILSSSLM